MDPGNAPKVSQTWLVSKMKVKILYPKRLYYTKKAPNCLIQVVRNSAIPIKILGSSAERSPTGFRVQGLDALPLVPSQTRHPAPKTNVTQHKITWDRLRGPVKQSYGP